jgi:adenylate cyclase class 2
MTFEVELKARLADPAAVEVRAAELGEFTKETHKEDAYFRRRGDTSSYPAERFRLRREEGTAVVTFKQPVKAGGVEVNEEVEFEVDDAHAFFRFAGRFGFEPFVIKRKQARIYRIGRAHVELNEVEHLGHFVEIEILCETEDEVPVARIELARLLNELDLTAADLERRPYIVMIQEAHPVQYRFVDDQSLSWPFTEK